VLLAKAQTQNMEPLTYNSTSAEAMADLKTVIQAMKKTKIITENKITYTRNLPAQLWGLSMMLNFI